MYNKTFTCEIITPLFLGGADQLPELRPPSIRGAMRWWFRAMMGGIMGDSLNTDVRELQRLETIVFGNNDTSSSISVRVNHISKMQAKKYKRLPHEEGKKSAEQLARDVGEKLNITIKLNPWVKENEEEIFNVAQHCCLLMMTFGGLGTRSRRGFGSLSVNEIIDEKELIITSIQKFETLCNKYNITRSGWSTIPEFPCIASNYFKVWYVESNKEWEHILAELMNHMSQFKYLYRSVSTQNTIGGIIKHSKYRQSSPLIIHMKKMNENKYRMIISHFRYKLHDKFSIDDNDRNILEEYIKDKLTAKRIGVFE